MCIVFSVWIDGDEPAMFFQLFSAGFGPHNIVVEEVRNNLYFTDKLYTKYDGFNTILSIDLLNFSRCKSRSAAR